MEDAFAHHVWATLRLIDACLALSDAQLTHPRLREPSRARASALRYTSLLSGGLHPHEATEHTSEQEREESSVDRSGFEREVIYLRRLPRNVPTDKVLVHNSVEPTRSLNTGGFRAWLSAPGPERYEVCDCPWASELGPHFRVAGSTPR